jgi:hypothetical protein
MTPVRGTAQGVYSSLIDFLKDPKKFSYNNNDCPHLRSDLSVLLARQEKPFHNTPVRQQAKSVPSLNVLTCRVRDFRYDPRHSLSADCVGSAGN